MIEHTVSFTLNHPSGSSEEADFLKDLRTFAEIPGVKNFRVNRQVSPKGPFAYQISMWFDDQRALEAYDASQAHVDFVNDRWLPEVASFQTLDFVEI
ncbi:Dabb family protein [Paenarthrobacter nicotinovorans]|uniref:Dabb family protein n=1 Tax=Paenarthrobacter nicotinovorans TaxID=29320 RepID=UPI00381EFE4A